MMVDISIFNNELEEGEQLEWVGRTEHFELMDDANKSSIWLRWILCAVAAIVVNGAYIYHVSVTDGLDMQIMVFVVTLGIPLLIAFSPMRDRRDIQKKMLYAVTNKRAIVFRGFSNKFFSMNFDAINEIKVTKRGNDRGDVILGSGAVQAPERKMRGIALTPRTAVVEESEFTGDSMVTGMVFYNVAEIDKLEGLVKKLRA